MSAAANLAASAASILQAAVSNLSAIGTRYRPAALAGGLCLAAIAAAPAGASAGDARTVRIETRPFYGATVTVESGVRVYRPMPADDVVIINPNGRSPLNIDVGRPVVQSVNVSQHVSTGGYAGGGTGFGLANGTIGGYLPRSYKLRHRGQRAGGLIAVPARAARVGGLGRGRH